MPNPRPRLPHVTLVAIDTRAPTLALQSMQRSMQQVEFGRAVLLTGDWRPDARPDGVEIVTIAPIASAADYSRFVVRDLAAHVDTPHVLVTQWDGFVVDATAWRDDFLDHDYIGAVWPDQPDGRNVGNGGFSLRSRRFLAAGADPAIVDLHPEDEALCRRLRPHLEREHGIRFAPAALARRFAFENERASGRCFGFHGAYHLPSVLDEATLSQWLDVLPDAFFRGRDARRLARALLRRGMAPTAQQLLRRRRDAGLRDGKTRWLTALAAVAGLASRRR